MTSLSEKPQGCRLSDLSDAVDIPKSTTHRILKSLEQQGWVEQDPASRRYRLGAEFIKVTSRVIDRMDIRRAAHQTMEGLMDTTGRACFLSVVRQQRIFCIHSIAARLMTSRLFVEVGKDLPVHASAAAKAIVAFLPEPQRDALIEHALPFEAFTEFTITRRDELKEDLTQVRARGFAECREELDPAVYALAVPIRAAGGGVVASLTLLGPVGAGEVPPAGDDPPPHLRQLQLAAEEISRHISIPQYHWPEVSST